MRTFFERDSIDNQGGDVVSTVHFDKNYSNAFWDGRQLVFGDGDGRYVDSFTQDSDIYAHEFTHGMMQYDVNLLYQDQAGALNESISDVFGIMTKQYINGETVDASNWLIGEKLFVGEEYALRSMKNPGTAYLDHPVFGDDPQPASMDSYDDTTEDNGGVHINSGIPNRAFYLAASKLRNYDHDRYSYSWEGVGKVWYRAGRSIGSNPTFSEFANKTVEAAQEIFGRDSYVEKACRYARGDVKVELASSPTPAPQPDSARCCTIL
jgi:Zn-dependent metalloprotease